MKIKNYIFIFIYFLVLDFIWVNYCVQVWHAFYYLPSELGLSVRIIGYAFFAAPTLLRSGKVRASTLITLLIYLLGFAPIMVSLMNNYGGRDNVLLVQHGLVLTGIMFLAFFVESNARSVNFRVGKSIPFNFVFVTAIVVLGVQLIFFRGNIRLVSLTDVYSLREENSSSIPTFLRYIFSWADTVLFPFLIIIGSLYNKKRLLIIGCMAMFLQYLIFGSKISLFLPLMLLVMTKALCSRAIMRNIIPYFVSLVTVVAMALFYTYDLSEGLYVLSAIILMRGLTISGCLYSGYYVPFFASHEYTYFSHINLLNKFTGLYPYGDLPLGKVVSYDGMNANAIFFAMDGVSGGGIFGVILIGLIYCIYIYFINVFITEARILVFQLWMIVPVMALLNTSFFTFLLSEGAAIILILSLYVGIKKNPRFWGLISV